MTFFVQAREKLSVKSADAASVYFHNCYRHIKYTRKGRVMMSSILADSISFDDYLTQNPLETLGVNGRLTAP